MADHRTDHALPATARLEPEPDGGRGAGHTLGAGSVLDDRYRLDSLVGLGGTATVYRATDLLLDRQVAVKVFHPHFTDPAMVARQRQEMQIVAALRHPNLILLHDARTGSAGSGPAYLVLEFVDGPTLGERLQGPPLTPAEVAHIGSGVATALQAMHARGLVHRDVKPGNILLTGDGDAKLSDFGIARMLDADRVTNSADVVGTAPYLSPEQASSADVGPPADIYALGLVLLECLKGHREYPGPAVESAVARLLRDPAVPPDLPAGWSALLASMTAFEAADRPAAEDVVAALRALERPAGTPSLVAGDLGPRRSRWRSVLVAAGAAALVTGLTTAGVLLSTDPPPAESPPGAGAPSVSSAVPSRPAGSAAASSRQASTAPVRATTSPTPAPAPAAPARAPSAAPAPTQTRAAAVSTPEPRPEPTPEPTEEPQQTPAPAGDPNPGNGNGNNGNGNGNGGSNGNDNGGGNGNGNGGGNGNNKGGNGNGNKGG